MTRHELRRAWADPEQRIRLLMITNESIEGTEYGFRDEFQRLRAGGVISAYRALAPRALVAAGQDWFGETIAAARELQPNVVLVLSPGQLPASPAQIRQLLEVSSPRLLYWEGDAWGRGKPMTQPMRSWAAAAHVVFTVASSPQSDAFARSTRACVRPILQTYCQVQFEEAEDKPPGTAAPAEDVVMIGSSIARLGVVSTVPGSFSRRRLVRQLQRESLSSAIYGRGWNGPASRGPVPYREQIARLREAKVSTNWDHFPDHECYASDRLPISLLAGRVHVTTRHPGPTLYRTEGLVEVDSVDDVVESVGRLLRLPWDQLCELGRGNWQYARHRLSDREAARFMLRVVDRRVPAPPSEPWDRIDALADKRDSVSLGARPLTPAARLDGPSS